MIPTVHENCHMDSEDLIGPIFHPLVTTSFVFWHNRCYRGGGQADSVIGATACTHCSWQSSLIRTFQQILKVHLGPHVSFGGLMTNNWISNLVLRVL
jgi:hypothetical protein